MKTEEIIDKYRNDINKVYSKEEIMDMIEKFPEIEYALLNLVPLLNIQPESSKREDFVLSNIPEYGSNSSLNFDEWQRRCGTPNSMET